MTKCLHQIRFLLPFNSKVLFYFKNRIKKQSLFIYLWLCGFFSVLAESRGHSLAGGAQASPCIGSLAVGHDP